MLLLELRVLSETTSLPPKVGVRSAYALSSRDPMCGITLGMFLFYSDQLWPLLSAHSGDGSSILLTNEFSCH